MYCMYFPVVETERHITVNIFILWHYCSCKRVKTWNISPRRCAGSSCSLGIGGWTCCSRLRTGGRGSSRRNTCIKLFLWEAVDDTLFYLPNKSNEAATNDSCKIQTWRNSGIIYNLYPSLQPEHDGVLLTSVATYALQWGQLVETGWVVKADTCTLKLRRSQT